MPITLYDPESQSKQPLLPGRAVVLACAPVEGGSPALEALRLAVSGDVLQRLQSQRKRPDSTLASMLEQVADDEFAREYEPEALRYWLLSVHYRAPLALDEATTVGHTVSFPQIEESERRLAHVYAAQKRHRELPAERILPVQTVPPEALSGFSRTLRQALDDDLNTPLALDAVQEFTVVVNGLCDGALRKRGHVNASTVEAAREGFATMRGLLGIGADDPTAFLLRVRDRRARRLRIDVLTVEDKLALRSEARAAKDFATADRLQNELLALGIVLVDGAQGTSWSIG
jgi:cysteinyl-tRNA synthetase